MSKYKDFKEFRKQFKDFSIADHVFLNAASDLTNEQMEDTRENGFELKLLINGIECDFSAVMEQINNHFERLEEEAKSIRDEEITRLFKEKVSDRLYDIMNHLEEVDDVIKESVSWGDDVIDWRED